MSKPFFGPRGLVRREPISEKQRIADYQRGWNDATGRQKLNSWEPVAYHLGFIEATSRTPNRFHDYEGA